MIIIVDSDGLIGSTHAEDLHYQTSNNILEKLNKAGSQFIYPATVIAESVTFLQGRLNKPKLAHQIIEMVRTNLLVVEPVDKELLQQAIPFMNLKSSKRHTLFDAIVAATAQKYKADAIFSFDKFYKSNGFKLASDLL